MLDQATYIPDGTESGKLPQDIINACREISKKAYEAADSTKISHSFKKLRYLDKYRITREEYEQIFISLVARPLLNVCEVVGLKNRYFSIGINLEKIQETTSYHEVSADILLLGLIFDSDHLDRGWSNAVDDEKLWNKYFWDRCDIIGEQHNFIYFNGKYNIFDLEVGGLKTGKIKKSEVSTNFISFFVELYQEDQSRITEELLKGESERMKIIIDRMLEKIILFLEHYDCIGGRALFLSQIKKSGIAIDDHENFYTNFINNLNTIKGSLLEMR